MGCKEARPKKELVRVVRTPEGEIVVDPTGKKSGRGAYTCPNLECLELALKGAILEKSLEVSLSADVKADLRMSLLKLIQTR